MMIEMNDQSLRSTGGGLTYLPTLDHNRCVKITAAEGSDPGQKHLMTVPGPGKSTDSYMYLADPGDPGSFFGVLDTGNN